MEPGALALNDYFDILKRRKWSLALPALIVFVMAVTIAMMLPSIFKSSATILIEEQEIPENFVVSTVTSYAEQRLQSIKQRIMSTTRLMEMINRFNLYTELKEKWTSEEIVQKMRDDIKFDTISADVVDRQTGRPSIATIAFSLSYEGKNPNKVQQVTSMLTSLYLEENLKVRTRRTKETYTFLDDEKGKVKADLNVIEKKIAVFKEAHINALPELLQVNVQGLNNIERSIERIEEQLRSLKEREGYLQTQLASIPESVDPDKKRLQELKMQLTHLTTRYSDHYPDVIKTRAEIAELEKRLNDTSKPSDSTAGPPDNTAYITLSAQLASTRADIDSVKLQIHNLNNEKAKYQQRIESTPKIEQEYNGLIVERRTTHAKFDDLMRKLMEARVAYGLEEEQKGERFTLIDPALFPEKPFKPNRMAIVLIGFVLGVGAGVGFGALREFADHSVKNPIELARLTNFPVLASIPEIITDKDITRRRVKRIVWAGVSICVIAGGIAVFHFLVMDLDIFWVKLMRKVDRLLVFKW
jgi:succinoglycan biosynthesis transport protein ExoP